MRRAHASLRLALWVAIAAAVSVDAHPGRDGALLRWLYGVVPASSRPARLVFATSSPVAFYRATLPLFARDWADPTMPIGRTRFAVAGALPLGLGDPHVENFGTLLGVDGRVTFEPNDLDAAGRVNYLWDLRRLTVGLCLAARMSNHDAPSARRAAIADAREIAREAALAYASALQSRPGEPVGDPSAAIDDLLDRAQAAVAERGELAELTEVRGEHRRLRRGATDPEEPQRLLVDLPLCARDSLPGLLQRYRATLPHSPAEGFFTPLDVALRVGRGGATSGSLRALVLLRGPTEASDDDLIVEVKALAQSPENSPVERLLAARAALWSRADADPYWGAASWLGHPVQLRAESDAARSLRISHLRGALGTPSALRALARSLGARLARIHRRSLPTPAPHAALLASDPQGFANEQAEVSILYTEQVVRDVRLARRLARGFRPSGVTAATAGCDPFEARSESSPRSASDGL